MIAIDSIKLKQGWIMGDKKIKILVVDDFANMRMLVHEMLKKIGYDVVEAEDGMMALKALKSQKFDVVVSDWNMPKMTGLELLKAVRADAELAKIPFLMITAEALQEHIIAAAQAGVNDYILKPFTAEVLNGKIKKMMGNIEK